MNWMNMNLYKTVVLILEMFKITAFNVFKVKFYGHNKTYIKHDVLYKKKKNKTKEYEHLL